MEDITRLAPVYLHPQGVCAVKIMAMTYNIYGDTYNMQHIASYMKAKPKSRNLYFSFASLKVCYTCNRAPYGCTCHSDTISELCSFCRRRLVTLQYVDVLHLGDT